MQLAHLFDDSTTPLVGFRPMSRGTRMKEARLAVAMTQRELAHAAGVSQQLISALENDDYEGTANIVGLAVALNVRTEWLETGQGPRHGDQKSPRKAKPDAELEAIRFSLASLFSLTVVARPRAALEMAASMRERAEPEVLREPFLKDVLAILESAEKKNRGRG